MAQTISASHAAWPLFLQCFLSGLVDSISYSTTQTWIAFMTGNLTQLALALVESVLPSRSPSGVTYLVVGDPSRASSNGRLLLSSMAVLGFCVGSFMCSRFVLRPKRGNGSSGAPSRCTRRKYVLLSLAHVLPFLIYPVLQRTHPDASEDPNHSVRQSAWLLFLLAIPLGSQSHAALSLGKHPFATTVVFTSSLSSLCSDISILPYSATSQTGQRASSILALVVGATLGGTLMRVESWHKQSLGDHSGDIQTAWAWYAVVVLQLVIALAWYLVKGEDSEDSSQSSEPAATSTPALEPYRDDPAASRQSAGAGQGSLA
ncbi:unnamed protein product [Parajaminaea phylloscopi]